MFMDIEFKVKCERFHKFSHRGLNCSWFWVQYQEKPINFSIWIIHNKMNSFVFDLKLPNQKKKQFYHNFDTKKITHFSLLRNIQGVLSIFFYDYYIFFFWLCYVVVLSKCIYEYINQCAYETECVIDYCKFVKKNRR